MNDDCQSTVWVDIQERVVKGVGIAIPALRNVYICLKEECRINGSKPSLRPVEVPCPEVIEVGFRVAFFRGES